MRNRTFLLVLACIFLSSLSIAQDAAQFFSNKDYQRAALAYERGVKSNPADYLKLAKCYFALQEFDKSIDCLNKYKSEYSSADKTLADKWLALLQREDERVKVENLGSNINTSGNEFLPRIMQDGKTLYFLAANRAGGVGGEDIWYSTQESDGSWSKPVNFTKLNTSSHEGILAISPDENVAIVFGNYQGSFGGGDLFYSVRKDDNWTPPCNLGGTINTSKWESLACIGIDGKTMIYCTDKGDGRGSDLWVTFLSEDGWSTPKNLGTTVNSSDQEKFPFLSADGKTLYFSSNGHFGFGGYDVFMTRRLDDSWTKWTEPVNLGKFINTLEDDADLSIPASGKKAYIVRDGMADGYGKDDIYEFLMPFNMRPEQLFKLYGKVYNEKDTGVQVNIRFVDMVTKEDVTKVTSSGVDGSYLAALPLNRKYLAVIDMKGYLYYSEEIDLTDPAKYRKSTNFQEKIKEQKTSLNQLKAELDRLNRQIESLNQSSSPEVNKVFEDYEKTLKQYRSTLDEIDALVYRAKYNWMTEESGDLSLEKDFHIQTAKIGAKFELKNIFFDLGKATLREESKVELDKLYEIMKNSDIVIELGGHTDSIGSDEANLKLSQDRVNSVKSYLTGKGIPDKRMNAVGYGEREPVASNSTEQGRQLNRRVEVKILRLVADPEGSDVVTESDKKKKPQEVVVVEQEKGDMLPILQAAARKGGLPSGSTCNNVDFYSKWNWETPIPVVKSDTGGGLWNFDDTPIDRKNNVFKAFNLSLINFAYKDPYLYIGGYEASNGVSMTLVDEDLNESSLEYFYSNAEGIGMGFGFSHLRMFQTKPLIKFPLNYMAGIEAKAFTLDSMARREGQELMWHANVPLGLRFVLPVQESLIVAPEFIWSLGIARSKDYLEKMGHIRLGGNVRWKFVHAGLHIVAGKNVGFLGYRLGVSF
ncbi:MAG: OmpA family protein [Flavobacteriales bacterium]|nr:OmpA family protein [Flavobacteriales bacterium]